MALPSHRRAGSLPAVADDDDAAFMTRMRRDAPHHVNPPPPEPLALGDVNVARLDLGARLAHVSSNLWGDSAAASRRAANLLLPGENFGAPRHLRDKDPTFIFGGRGPQVRSRRTVRKLNELESALNVTRHHHPPLRSHSIAPPQTITIELAAPTKISRVRPAAPPRARDRRRSLRMQTLVHRL